MSVARMVLSKLEYIICEVLSMITNRSDYMWVTIPDDMLINGEIMPLR